MSREEIRDEFYVSVRTLYNWRKKKQIPFGIIGGKIYYDRCAIEEMLKKGWETTAIILFPLLNIFSWYNGEA